MSLAARRAPMRARRRLPLRLLALAGLAAPLVAQEHSDPPALPTTAALLLRLQAANTTLDDARAIAARLHDRDIGVRLQVFKAIARHYGAALADFGRTRDRLVQRAGRSVPRLVRARLDAGATAEVERLRAEAHAISFGAGLSKERIHAELDPKLARLSALVLITPAELLAGDDELARLRDGLQAEQDSARGWFDLYLDTMRGLEDDAAGRRAVDRHEQLPDAPAADAVDAELELRCLCDLPLGDRSRRVLAANDALLPTMEREEYLGTLELNRIRIALGLAPLAIDPKLGDAARDHSHDMHELGFFSHASPVPGKRSFGDRAARCGTSASAENIAAGHDTGAGAIRGWWYSPGHHRNMLGDHARTGLGRCEQLWTQMFGG